MVTSVQEKAYGTLKFGALNDQQAYEEQPLRTVGTATVVESHNSSPNNVLPKVHYTSYPHKICIYSEFELSHVIFFVG